VPLAMITLVDDHAAIVKSADGQVPATQPRDLSFCGHTILGDAPLVVSDTLLDERFADNPQVVGDPGVRFYAGFPLRLRDGACVGSLCLIDYAPREFTAGGCRRTGAISARWQRMNLRPLARPQPMNSRGCLTVAGLTSLRSLHCRFRSVGQNP
jgi:hypothetical protein